MIVGLVGTKGAGKDTAADHLVEQFGFKKRAFADPIKEAVTHLFHLGPEQLVGDNKEVIDDRHGMSPRQMLQRVGTDMFRGMMRDTFWVDHFEHWYVHACVAHSDLVVPDIRFQNEVDLIKRLGGTVVRIDRCKQDQGRHTEDDHHVSETGVRLLTGIDAVIQNDSTIEALQCRLEKALGYALKKKM
jgi:hypothetical protein